MSSLAFDTLEYVQKLKAVGVPEKQAEAHAHALSEVIESNLATKDDIKDLKYELKNDIKDIKYEISLLKCMMGVILAGTLSLVLKAFFML
ncbi:MAG: DUF1640 domain-containing protein [Nitrospirota bacterium]